MKVSRTSHSFDLLFVMTLMFAFIVIALLLVGFGSNLYKNTVDTAETNYQLRTALSYVSNKVNHNAACEHSYETVNGVDALLIREQISGRSYTTYIYYFDGALYEQFTEDAINFDPQNGTMIIEVQSFGVTVSGNILSLTATAAGGASRTVSIPIG